MNTIPEALKSAKLPVIAAPMFLVSGPELVIECCKNGVIGTFPALNERSSEGFEQWLITIKEALEAHERETGEKPAPYGVNLIVHPTNTRVQQDVELCVKHKVPLVITSLGAISLLVDAIHSYGGLVFHDIVKKRHAEKAAEAAKGYDNSQVLGADTASAAGKADIVVIAVPYSSHSETLTEIRDLVQGKIVIDAVVPLVPPKVSLVQLPKEGSASMIAQSILGEGVRVIAAYHNVGAAKLAADGPVECDVLICGNDQEAREITVTLTQDAGLRGVEAGPLPNSVAVEAMTSILIGINRRYKIDCAGIRITGLESPKGS